MGTTVPSCLNCAAISANGLNGWLSPEEGISKDGKALPVWMTENSNPVLSVWLGLSHYGDIPQALNSQEKWGR